MPKPLSRYSVLISRVLRLRRLRELDAPQEVIASEIRMVKQATAWCTDQDGEAKFKEHMKNA